MHELSHLGESVWVGLARLAATFWVLLLAGWVPLERMLGVQGFLFLVAASLVGASMVMRLARRMEKRADQAGVLHERHSGDYARALERLHEVNLVPVVIGGRNRSHPELYERMAAAGNVPGYPRPAAPSRIVPWLAIFLPFIAALFLFPFAHGFFLRLLGLI